MYFVLSEWRDRDVLEVYFDAMFFVLIGRRGKDWSGAIGHESIFHHNAFCFAFAVFSFLACTSHGRAVIA